MGEGTRRLIDLEEDIHQKCGRVKIDSLAPAGASPGQRHIAALKAWSIVHGLAMLMLDKQVSVDDAVIDAVIDSASVGIAT